MYGVFLPHLSKKTDKYGFANEHEIRIATGVTFLLTTFSFFLVLFKAEFTIPLVLISIVVVDFFLKVFFGPQYSIFGSFVRMFIAKREPMWVGTVQKRFAWGIGLFLSIFVLYCLLLLGGHLAPSAGQQAMALEQIMAGIKTNIANNALVVTPMNPAIIACVLCIVFMRFESVAGYCVGCSIYKRLVKKKWLKAHANQNCVNGVCKV